MSVERLLQPIKNPKFLQPKYVIQHFQKPLYSNGIRDNSSTLIPADLHFVTASGTAALGGSIIDINPTNLRSYVCV